MGVVAVLYGWLVSCLGPVKGELGGGSTPGHRELIGKDRERKKVGNKVQMK
jgi:hypothetical protein